MRVTYERGDVVTFKDGVAVVLDQSKAILIRGIGGRNGYDMEVGAIPPNALLAKDDFAGINFEIQMAIRGILEILKEEGKYRYMDSSGERLIHFEFEGEEYTLPMGAYSSPEILLPDGRVLSVEAWLESLPPIPDGLTVNGSVNKPIARKVS